MHFVLASAETIDYSQTNLPMVLSCVGELVGVCLLVFLVLALAYTRRHRQAEIITTLAIFWGLVAIASFAYTTIQQFDWSQEFTQRLETGYQDPSDTSAAPQIPWGLWIALAGGYGLLMVWAISQNNAPATDSNGSPDEPVN